MGSTAGYKIYARAIEQMCEGLFPEMDRSSSRRISIVILCTHHVDNYIDAVKDSAKKERENFQKYIGFLEVA
jgi:hypothetical protein